MRLSPISCFLHVLHIAILDLITLIDTKAVFLNRRAAASIIPGRERPEETTICYKISLVQLITNLNVILYSSTYHTLYIIILPLWSLTTYINVVPRS